MVELIAHGGMGAVYRGERLGLGRQVAIKFLRTTFARDPNVRRRFELEAEAMSRLSHPNCIGVLDFGVEELPYLVMDLVLGEELRDIIDRGPLPIVRALRIGRQVLAALAHAHERGIVHRDIKPENIVLEQGSGLEDHARILDFGLAKLLGSDFGLTMGIAVGTPNYMAPEQAGEGGVDGRTDLYAAGIVLVEMLRLMPDQPMIPKRMTVGTTLGMRASTPTRNDRNISDSSASKTVSSCHRPVTWPHASASDDWPSRTVVPVARTVNPCGKRPAANSSTARANSPTSAERDSCVRTMTLAREKSRLITARISAGSTSSRI